MNSLATTKGPNYLLPGEENAYNLSISRTQYGFAKYGKWPQGYAPDPDDPFNQFYKWKDGKIKEGD